MTVQTISSMDFNFYLKGRLPHESGAVVCYRASGLSHTPKAFGFSRMTVAVFFAVMGVLALAYFALIGNSNTVPELLANNPAVFRAQIPGEPGVLPGVSEAQAEPQEDIAVLSAVEYPAARIVIGKIGVDMPLLEGINEDILWQGAWRYPWGSTPDAGGNTVIFGHRYRYLPPNPETFYALDKLAVGDTFEVQWEGKTYQYKVVETKIVPPTDLSVLDETGYPTVTLITCTPVFTTKDRLVVRGELL